MHLTYHLAAHVKYSQKPLIDHLTLLQKPLHYVRVSEVPQLSVKASDVTQTTLIFRGFIYLMLNFSLKFNLLVTLGTVNIKKLHFSWHQ